MKHLTLIERRNNEYGFQANTKTLLNFHSKVLASLDSTSYRALLRLSRPDRVIFNEFFYHAGKPFLYINRKSSLYYITPILIIIISSISLTHYFSPNNSISLVKYYILDNPRYLLVLLSIYLYLLIFYRYYYLYNLIFTDISILLKPFFLSSFALMSFLFILLLFFDLASPLQLIIVLFLTILFISLNLLNSRSLTIKRDSNHLKKHITSISNYESSYKLKYNNKSLALADYSLRFGKTLIAQIPLIYNSIFYPHTFRLERTKIRARLLLIDKRYESIVSRYYDKLLSKELDDGIIYSCVIKSLIEIEKINEAKSIALLWKKKLVTNKHNRFVSNTKPTRTKEDVYYIYYAATELMLVCDNNENIEIDNNKIIKYCKAGLKIHPENSLLHNRIAYSYCMIIDKSNYEYGSFNYDRYIKNAIKHITKAQIRLNELEKSHKRPIYYPYENHLHTYAVILFLLRDYRRGKSILEYLARNFDLPDALLHLAYVYMVGTVDYIKSEWLLKRLERLTRYNKRHYTYTCCHIALKKIAFLKYNYIMVNNEILHGICDYSINKKSIINRKTSLDEFIMKDKYTRDSNIGSKVYDAIDGELSSKTT
ncbi:hypothetical protein KQI63_07525 [bacterium]|nr:hypothetical protein [bacterium]